MSGFVDEVRQALKDYRGQSEAGLIYAYLEKKFPGRSTEELKAAIRQIGEKRAE